MTKRNCAERARSIRLVEHEGEVYRVGLRTLIAIVLAGPQGGAEVLLQKGYRLYVVNDAVAREAVPMAALSAG